MAISQKVMLWHFVLMFADNNDNVWKGKEDGDLWQGTRKIVKDSEQYPHANTKIAFTLSFI